MRVMKCVWLARKSTEKLKLIFNDMRYFRVNSGSGFTKTMYGVRNLEMTIRFYLKSQPSERFHRPEISQIKAEISLRTNVKLIFHKNVGLQWYQWIPDFYNIRFWANLFNGKKLCGLKSYVIKNQESIDIIDILHFYENSTSHWYEGWSQL